MSIALDDLWKNATDEAIIESVGKWESLNEQGQRLVHAEVKRRGLSIAVPEVTAEQPADNSQSARASGGFADLFKWKTLLGISVVLALVVALALAT